VRSWGGELLISNKITGHGAVVTIELAHVELPSCLVRKIVLRPEQQVIILDDDPYVITAIRKQFDQYNIPIESFTRPHEFISRAKQVPAGELSRTLFLVDHDLKTPGFTGLEVIAQLNIKANAILVTSMADEQDLIIEARRLGVRLYPKDLLKELPLKNCTDMSQRKIVVLDDEKLVRRIWVEESRIRSIDCLTFAAPHELEGCLGSLSRDDFFLIDSQLGREVKGELVMERLLKDGFKNVFAMTAMDGTHFAHIQGLKHILPKNPEVFFENHFI
jgi:CheY-like chemotaxis protein